MRDRRKALDVARRTGLYFAAICALLLPLSWLLGRHYEDGLERTLLAREQGYLDVTQRMVHREMVGACADLQVLGESRAVSEFLDADTPPARERLEEQWRRWARAYERYDQLRLIGLDGHELVRVDYRDGQAIVVPREQLADKVERYYVREALALAGGQAYVSPMDLNIENGRIQQPLQPVIRLAMPVNDGIGRRQAILVLNYRAQGLLDSFRATMAQSKLHQGMLLNDAGHWLSSPSRENEWGWLLDHPERSFALAQPAVWREIEGRDDPHALLGEAPGEVRNADGVHLYRVLYPLRFSAAELPNAASAERLGLSAAQIKRYRWVLVLFVPSEAWIGESLLRRAEGKWAMAGVLLLALAGCHAAALWRSSRRALQDERARNARELEELYEHAPCGYHSLDARGLVVRMNATELGWLGYRREEVVGKLRYAELAVPESRPELEQAYGGMAPGTAALLLQDFQCTMRRKDGTSFPVSINAAAVHSQSGELLLSRTTTMDITERRRLERQLEQQAQTDTLTGISNRRHFETLARRELSRAQRHGIEAALLMLDIDHFKRINDGHGHPVGDSALKAMTRACQGLLRSTDVFARLGGEEFAALLPDTDRPGALLVAERIRALIEALRLPLPPGEDGSTGGELAFTVSIGLALNEPRELGLDELLLRADKALYRAKQGGRNRVCE